MPKRRGRGEGSLEQLPSGSWRAVCVVGYDRTTKRRIRESATFPTKGEALAWQRERQALRPSGSVSSRVTLGQWFAAWSAGRADTVAGQTARSDADRWNRHLSRLASVPLKDLDADRFRQWLEELRGAGVSANERQASGTVLRKILNAAVEAGLLQSNPAATVKLPRRQREEIMPLTAVQMRAVLAAAGRYEPLFRLWFDSGIRPGELFALEWSDVDWTRGEINVQRSYDPHGRTVKVPKTRKSRRRIALAASTMASLRAHRALRTDAFPLVFGTLRGKYWNPANFRLRVFVPTLQKAGVPVVRPYDVRHTSASLLLASGVNIKVVSERLGHEDITTTLREYAHLMPGMQETAAASMESMFQADAKGEGGANVPRPPHGKNESDGIAIKQGEKQRPS